MSTNADERAAPYIERALEMIEQGQPCDPRELCGEETDLVEIVAAAIDMAPHLASWQRRLRIDRGGAHDPLHGRLLLERYLIAERIGAGAMGTVYRAHDRELKRDVAVKILHPYLLEGGAAERFDREAEVLAALRHPAVVGIHDRGCTRDGLRLLVMELLDGCSLAAVLLAAAAREEQPGSPAFLATDWLADEFGMTVPESNRLRLFTRWAADLAAGLAAAHSAGIFHRDVKPSNVFVTRDARALLLDFGVAGRSAEHTLGTQGTTVGTPCYMAPEQAEGRTQSNAALDIYGLTATLYHLLTMRPPYEGDPTSVLMRLRHEDPVPAARLHPGLPRDLRAILECGMARAPARRYADAVALEADLRAFLEHRPVQARPMSRLERVARRSLRSRSARLGALATVALAIAIAAPWWLGAREQRRLTELAQSRAVLPPLAGVEGAPHVRRIQDDAERSSIAAALDRTAAIDAGVLLPRLTRAAFRLDHADASGAAEDLRELARRWPAPYLTELATRYAAHRDGGPLRLDDLPSPVTAEERMASAFLALRDKTIDGYRRAHETLAPVVDTHAEALELDLLARLALGAAASERDEQRRLLTAAHDGALRLEGLYGRPTARTRFVIGAVLVKLQRYDHAIGPLRECIALSPHSHGAHLNLSIACRRLGRLEEAEAELGEALRGRPEQWNTLVTLSQLQEQRGRFDQALETIARIDTGDAEEGAALRAELAGDVHVSRALAARDEETRAACAELAADCYRQALAHGATVARVGMNLDMATGLRDGDTKRVLAGFLHKLARDPLNADQIHQLADRLPSKLDADHLEALRRYLRSLAEELAPMRSAASDK